MVVFLKVLTQETVFETNFLFIKLAFGKSTEKSDFLETTHLHVPFLMNRFKRFEQPKTIDVVGTAFYNITVTKPSV